MEHVQYNIISDRRIRVGMIGCGWHPYMNILPSLRYAPVDLVATCDVDLPRARNVARLFGSSPDGRCPYYSDYRELLDRESGRLDAVLIVTNYGTDGKPRYPQLASAALQAGLHVWMEKPPGSTVMDVKLLKELSGRTGRYVQVGIKKGFYPAVQKLCDISQRPEFGRILSLNATYPLRIPPEDKRNDAQEMRSLLDVLWHPAGAIQCICGDAEYMTVRSGPGGSGVALLKFENGAVGNLHMTGGEPQGVPAIVMEWMEVVGGQERLVLDNNIRLSWFRQPTAAPFDPQRSSSFIDQGDSAENYWEPEMSRGTVYNSNHMLSGYALEINHFANSVLTGVPPNKGDLDQCEEIMAWFEACAAADGERIDIRSVRRGREEGPRR